jgi:MFS family permease
MAPTEQTPLVLEGMFPGHQKAKPAPPGAGYGALLARAVCLGSSVAEGYDLGIFSVTILPVVREFGLHPWQVSLLAGVPALSVCFGTSIAGFVMDRIGRKPVIAASYVLLVIGSIAFASANGFMSLLVSRCVLMVGCSVGMVAVTVYMAEIAPTKMRGMLVSLEELAINVGLLTALFTGHWVLGRADLGWRVVAGLGALLPAFCLSCLSVLAVPESARFKEMQGRHREARVILKELFADDPDEIETTLKVWEAQAETQAALKAEAEKRTTYETVVFKCRLLIQQSIGIATSILVMKVLSGHAVIGAYIVMFMADSMGESQALEWAVGMQVMKLVGLVPACFWLLDKYGRRPLLIASAIGCMIGLATVAGGFQMGLKSWVIGCGFLCYALFFSIGLGPVVPVYVAEILPTNVRGVAMGMIIIPARIVDVFLLSSAPILFNMGPALLFGAFVFSNFVGMIFFFMCCPETSGVMLEDVNSVLVHHLTPKGVKRIKKPKGMRQEA